MISELLNVEEFPQGVTKISKVLQALSFKVCHKLLVAYLWLKNSRYRCFLSNTKTTDLDLRSTNIFTFVMTRLTFKWCTWCIQWPQIYSKWYLHWKHSEVRWKAHPRSVGKGLLGRCALRCLGLKINKLKQKKLVTTTRVGATNQWTDFRESLLTLLAGYPLQGPHNLQRLILKKWKIMFTSMIWKCLGCYCANAIVSFQIRSIFRLLLTLMMMDTSLADVSFSGKRLKQSSVKSEFTTNQRVLSTLKL